MKQKVIQYIKEKKLFDKGAHLVVGVSGGADSVCLLHLLCAIRKDWDLTLTAVHVNHGIRGKEAGRDADFVEKLTEQWEVSFVLAEYDVVRLAKELGLTEEEAGRKVRYEEFRRVAAERGADAVVVAHHLDDQAETVLFRMSRGSGIGGMAGMAPKNEIVVRPLLGVTRKEIEIYLEQHDISYCKDSTNEKICYARNYIRKKVIPQMQEQLNPQIVQHLADLAEDAGKWCRYVGRRVEQVAGETIQKKEQGEWTIEIPRLKEEDEVIQEEVLKKFLAMDSEGAKDVSRVHYNQMKHLLHCDTGKQIYLPGERVVERRYNTLLLRKGQEEQNSFFCMECEIPSVNIVKMNGQNSCITLEVVPREKLSKEIPQKHYTKWFDYDKIKNGLILRNPQKGDFFVLDESGHRKKLSRYYIDKKMPAAERKNQLVLAQGNRILWAIPERMDAGYKVSDSTKNVLIVTKEGAEQ